MNHISKYSRIQNYNTHACKHRLRTPREEIAFTTRPKIQSQSQIFRYGGSIFCLPHRPDFSDFFDLCLHWVSVVRGVCHSIISMFRVLGIYNLGLTLFSPKKQAFLVMQYCKKRFWRENCSLHAKHKWFKFEPLRRDYEFSYEFEDFLEENKKILDSFIIFEFRGCI